HQSRTSLTTHVQQPRVTPPRPAPVSLAVRPPTRVTVPQPVRTTTRLTTTTTTRVQKPAPTMTQVRYTPPPARPLMYTRPTVRVPPQPPVTLQRAQQSLANLEQRMKSVKQFKDLDQRLTVKTKELVTVRMENQVLARINFKCAVCHQRNQLPQPLP